MGGLSVDIDSDDSIFTGDQSVEKGDFSITFGLYSERDVFVQFVPKLLRFKPPGSHPVFQRIMDRASKHCLRARINICHDHIKTSKDNIKNTKRELSLLINEDTYSTLMSFLKSRTTSFHNNINARQA